MASVNNNYKELQKSNNWKISSSRQQSNGSQTSNWAFPINSNASYSKTSISSTGNRTFDTGRRKLWNTQDATLHFSNNKESNSCKVSERSNSEVGKIKAARTLQNKHQNLTSGSAPLSCSEVQKNVNSILSSNPSDDSSSNNTNLTITSTENANDVNFEANLEEIRRLRRERQKVKKEMKKQEKALQREEEMRKKRLAPKDQKVTIIDHSMLNRFLVNETTPVNEEVRSNPYIASEFPSLREIISTTSKRSSFRYQKRRSKKDHANVGNGTSVQLTLSETLGEPKTNTAPINSRDLSINSSVSASGPATVASNIKGQEKKETKSTDDSNIIIKPDDKTAGKRPKRRDPIHLDINEILKVRETKHEVSVKQHSSKPAPKTEAVRYAGNILDSDNPERKRGKQREVPKVKKPTSLKQIILKDREKRKESLKTDVITQSEVDDKDENKEENLTNKEISSRDNTDVSEKSIVTTAFEEIKSVDDKENEISLSDSCNVKFLKIQDITKDEHILLPLETIPVVKDFQEQQNLKPGKESNEHEKKILMEENEEMICMEEKRKLRLLLNGQKIGARPKSENKTQVPRIHSRKFREYCDHFITADILSATTSLLEDIVKFHDRQYAHSPLKASAKRRHVTGLKEVRRFLNLHRVRLLVIAPDLEPTTTSGGLDDLVTQLKGSAIANEVPYVFTLSRRHLGYILKKKVPVSCVGVLNYDGTEHNFRNLMSAVEKARQEYKLKVAQISPVTSESSSEINEKEETPSSEGDVNKEVVASLLAKLAGPPSHMKNTESSSPFLQAIQQCANVDSDSFSDEDQNEE